MKFLTLLVVFVHTSVFSDSLEPSLVMKAPDELLSTGELTQSNQSEPERECCKICTIGKACGNSCISRSKQCHKPPGCACDG